MSIHDNKLADYIGKYPNLLQFLERLDIELGFGDLSIGEICDKNGIDYYFFTELLNLITKKYQFDPEYIDKFEISLTVRYLKNSHKDYLNTYIPKLKKCLTDLSNEEGDRMRDFMLLFRYFNEYETEFREHLNNEDNSIYPYVMNLSNTYNNDTIDEDFIIKIQSNVIDDYLRHHDSLDDKLSDLKNLLIKYFKPFKNKELVHTFLKTIYELEEDLTLHELIENQILFRQAKNIEEMILQRFK